MKGKPLKLVIVSGKGGVGKSMLCSAFSLLFCKEKKIVAVDCDVDAPNLAIWLNERDKWQRNIPVFGSSRAEIDYKRCSGCGLCVSRCRFGAIGRVGRKIEVNSFLCEGCGACEVVCPAGAVNLNLVQNGEIKTKQTRYNFPLVLGHLFSGQTASGRVVAEVRKEADRFDSDLQLIDSSPGTGSPVIAALEGATLAVIIAEPTPVGLSDAHRIFGVVNHFKLPWGLVVNKWDINEQESEKIEEWAGDKLLGKISYDQAISRAASEFTPVMEASTRVAEEIRVIYNKSKETIFNL